jgi:hypothetical protein
MFRRDFLLASLFRASGAPTLHLEQQIPSTTPFNNLGRFGWRRLRRMFSAFLLLVTSFGAMLYAQTPTPVTGSRSPALTTAGPDRPAGVPEGYVITPNGYFHPSCVKELAQGDILRKDEGAIQHADGTLTDIAPCNYPHYTAKGESVSTEGEESAEPNGAHTAAAPTPSTSTYIEYAYIDTTTSYAGVIGSLTVPPAPSSNNGQTVFFFPGLIDDQVGGETATILQPVLGWNGFSSAVWTIASWNCCYDGVQTHSTPMTVSAGALIIGEVYSNCPSGSLTCSTWYVSTEDAGKGSTTLSSTSSYGQTFNYAFGATMEVYSVAQCSDYPSNGSLIFSGTVYNLDVLYGHERYAAMQL